MGVSLCPVSWSIDRKLFFTFTRRIRQGIIVEITSSWLRHCATSRKVAGSNPHGVTGNFHWHNAFGRTMALGPNQPLTEMSTRGISGAYRWPVRRADKLAIFMSRLSGNSESLRLLEPSGPVHGSDGIAFSFN
jgi:hypothetical protein